MPRYFFKIVVLPILDNNVVAGQCARDHVLDGLCASISAIKETTFVTPGISTYASELNLGGDNIVNADFWIIKDISKIDLQDILKGTDGAMILVDTTIDPDASTTIEYLGIIEREFRFLPSMIVAIDSSSPLTARDHGFAAKLWESRVVECTSVNQSALGMFVHVVTTLLTGIVNHQEVGPVFYEHDWLRTKVVWETMNAIIDQDKVSPQQMVYMGRNFNLLSLISSKKGKHDSHVLGSIAASWFEMAGEFMLGFHVTERLGLARRTLELKRKYLGSLVAEAKRLYNTSKFEEAALKYQEAAYWNKVEFIDRAGMETLFMNAIDAWVSIFGFDKVQGLLDQLQSPATFLSELKEKVYRGINFLVERNLLDKANFQLDAITRTFMKHDLHDTASELAKRHVDIKLALLGEKIKERFIGDALLLLDELATLQQHVATTINIPDACLATLCAFLLEDLNYSEYEKVAALVKDPAIAKQLEARRVVREAEIAEDEKHKKDSAKKNLYQRLLAYVEAERDDALEYAKSRRKIVHDMIDQGKSDQAYHFLKVTAQWLLDLEKPGISGDLVYYLVTIFVKNRFDVDLKDISTFIPKEKMEELVNHIQDYICGTGPKEMDLYFSDFVDHYMQQARSNNYYSQANMLRDKLEHTLLHEIEVLSTTLDGDTVDIMTSKIDKFLGVVAHSDIKHDYRARLDDIYGKLVDHYILKRDAIQADSYINHISTIEGKKACNAKLATLVAELDSERPDEYKARDEVRQLEEGLEDVLNALVREQSVVLTKRHERERRLKELQASLAYQVLQSQKGDLYICSTGLNPMGEYMRGLSFGDHSHIGTFYSPLEKIQFYDMIRNFIPAAISLSVNSPLTKGKPTDEVKVVKGRYAAPNCVRSIRLLNNTSMLSSNNPARYPPYLLEDNEQTRQQFLTTVGKADFYDARFQDVYPYTDFGTIEVRIADAQLSVARRIALCCLFQVLGYKTRKILSQGRYVPGAASECLVKNREKAVRQGLFGTFTTEGIDEAQFRQYDPEFANVYLGDAGGERVRYIFQHVERMFKWLAPEIKELGYTQFMMPLLLSVFGELPNGILTPFTEADYQLSMYYYKQVNNMSTNIMPDLINLTKQYSMNSQAHALQGGRPNLPPELL